MMDEDRRFVIIEDPNICYWCENRVKNTEESCFSCGFPQRAGEWEQRGWLGKARKDKKDYEVNLKWARTVLFVIAIYYLVAGFIEYVYSNSDLTVGFAGSAIVLVFVSLGIWARKNLYTPLLIGFVLFIILLILPALDDPMAIFRGVIIKIILVTSYIKSLKFARTVRNKREIDLDILHDE